ncbi:hypothetical protein ACQUFD_17480, partial [Enterococcus gallinarum]|uniref:hypothetical protein n=1 Tax=Enterococcus gallinarum TaxID=1353 RepID=UPI003D1396B0
AVIEFTNPRQMAQPSTSIKRIGVKTGEVKQALVVPEAAVFQQDGHSAVKRQKGSDWVVTLVETGAGDGTVIEIKSGLSEGDVVLAGVPQ